MKKILFLFLISFLFANNITYTKKKILKTKYNISKMNQKLDLIASKIENKENILQQINNKIDNLNKQIKILNKELNNSKTKLSEFNDLKKGLEEKANKIQNEITNFISENYFNSTSKTEDLNDLIDKEITKNILNRYSKKINTLIKENQKIQNQIALLNSKIEAIKQKQNILLQTKEKLALLQKTQQKALLSLNKEKENYKKRLQNLIKKEENLQNELAKLKIIKKREISRSTIHVKKYGSLYFTRRTGHYKGKKNIPPIKGKIIKRFGSYIDPIYNIRIYNDSITIKPYKKNAIVRAISNGRIVYVGKSNGKGVVIIRHKNNLFSIYANLDKISPILRKGLYVKKGQILARVNDSLEFEVTYKDRPINPTKVIALK